MVITIDGPAGVGKSTAARALARRLGFDFLDTGAMYRSVALSTVRSNTDPEDETAMAALLDHFHLEMPPGGRVLLRGEDVTAAIRTPQVEEMSSRVAASGAVRRRLVSMQREIARGRDLVTEGRDQGTVVFPEAICKFFLTANEEERARRRQADMAARGEVVELAAVRRAQETRDGRDASRDDSPLRSADDAVVLDTTKLAADEVVDRLHAEVQRRRAVC